MNKKLTLGLFALNAIVSSTVFAGNLIDLKKTCEEYHSNYPAKGIYQNASLDANKIFRDKYDGRDCTYFKKSSAMEDAIAAFSKNMPTPVSECLEAYNKVCGKDRLLTKGDLFKDAQQSCIKVTKNNKADFVVFSSQEEKLVSIFPLAESNQQCSQIQLTTKQGLDGLAKFGNSVAVATGGHLYEFHTKSVGAASHFFVNEILSQKKNRYTSVKSIAQNADPSRIEVTLTNKSTFIIDEEDVSSGSERSSRVGTFKGGEPVEARFIELSNY